MLYGYIRTSQGRKRSEFPLGTLEWRDKVILNIRDRSLRDKLNTYFQEPLWVPLPLGDSDALMGHTWDRLEPGDEEHFMEALKRLHRLDLFVDLDS
ncbi:MAG: hypothetical protein WC314_07675 [Vulcanimicrobiota bacterium]